MLDILLTELKCSIKGTRVSRDYLSQIKYTRVYCKSLHLLIIRALPSLQIWDVAAQGTRGLSDLHSRTAHACHPSSSPPSPYPHPQSRGLALTLTTYEAIERGSTELDVASSVS